jgi:hypothetical protein
MLKSILILFLVGGGALPRVVHGNLVVAVLSFATPPPGRRPEPPVAAGSPRLVLQSLTATTSAIHQVPTVDRKFSAECSLYMTLKYACHVYI